MKITLRALVQKTTLMATAFILAVSTLTAAVPFILSQKVDALTAYTSAALTTSELANWSPDRQTPSGGYGSVSFAGRTNVLEMNIDTANASADTFRRTEGLQRALTGYAGSVKADLYVEADWATKDVRAGLWGVGNNGVSISASAYPIVEFVSGNVPGNGGYTGWRIYNTITGAWTNLSGVAYNANGWNTLAVSLNRSTDKFEYFVNNALVGTAEGNGSVKLSATILNSYNNANNDVAYNYAAHWSNFAYGVTAPDHVYLDDDYTSASAGGHVWGYDAFSVLQDALDAVATNGTVHIADGVYTGTANITKDGTKLIGVTNSRDTVKIMPTASSGQAGLFVNGVNNVTIKNLGVYGANFGANGGLIKLNDGNNARIENVVVKNSNATGININGYSNVVVTGVYVADSAKDGISVVAQQEATSTVSKNITIQNTAISQRSAASWSALAFYTKSSSGILNSIEGVVISNVSTQYGQRGIYVEGVGGTVTNPGSDKLILDNVTVGQNTNEYINNEESADIDARSLKVNIGGGVVVPVSAMDQTQYDNVLGKIKDKTHKNPTSADYGYVYLATMGAPVITNSPVYVNSAEPYDYATWTHSGIGVKNFEYREYRNMAEADADIDGNTYSYWIQTKAATERQQRVGASWTGNKTLYYRVVAIDEAGNRSTPSALGTVIVDKVAPVTTLSGATDGGIYNAPVTIEGLVNDLNPSHYFLTVWKDGVKVNISGITDQRNATNFSYTFTNDAAYKLLFEARDLAGNKDASSVVELSFTLDQLAPDVAITSLTADRIEGTADVDAAIILTIDGVDTAPFAPEADGTWAYNFSPALGEGDHEVIVTVADAAGNAHFVTGTLNVLPTVDQNEPEVVVNINNTPQTPAVFPPAFNPAANADVQGASDENTAGVEGDSTVKTPAQAVDSDANQGNLLGLAWYWWILIIAALAAAAWWIVGAIRRRQAE